jgi:hypothetical protein
VSHLRCGSGGAVQTASDSALEPNTHDRARWTWGLGSPPVPEIVFVHTRQPFRLSAPM